MKKFFSAICLMLCMLFMISAVGCGQTGDNGGDGGDGGNGVTVTFENDSVTMEEWTTLRLEPSVSDGSGVSMSVSDASVLYLRGANITALKEGTATVTAVSSSDPNAKATLTVTVTENAGNRPALTLTGDSEIVTGRTGAYKATLSKAEEGSYDVTYGVSDENIANIAADGVLTALAGGTVTVTADVVYCSVSFHAEMEVEVQHYVYAVFEGDAETATVAVSEIKEDIPGDYSIEIGGKAYTADGEGLITLNKTDFAENDVLAGKLTVGTDVFNFYVRKADSTAHVYQNGTELIAGADGIRVNTAQEADENGLRWITFDDAADKTVAGFNYLRMTVKFENFGTLNAGMINEALSTYHYTFGYTFGNYWVFWDNNYVGSDGILRGAYGGSILNGTANATGFAYLRIYDADGALLLDYYRHPQGGDIGNWSPYIDPFELNTEYILEIGVKDTGDIRFSGIDGAVITDIEWARDSLKDTVTVDPGERVTKAGKIFQNGEELVADGSGIYRADADAETDDVNGLHWLTFDTDAGREYKYLVFKVKFNGFAEGLDGSITNTAGANGMYNYHFGFKHGGTHFFWDNAYADGGFGGAIDAASGSANMFIYFNIYDAEGNKVLNCMDQSGWTSNDKYYTLTLGTEYYFEFNVGAMGNFTISGFDNAEISEIEWATALKG